MEIVELHGLYIIDPNQGHGAVDVLSSSSIATLSLLKRGSYLSYHPSSPTPNHRLTTIFLESRSLERCTIQPCCLCEALEEHRDSGMPSHKKLFNALIRTHHITSRKKVTRLRQAADLHNVFVLLRSGGSPGMMYVEGESDGVHGWIEVVQKLRYKDYQLAARPSQTFSERSTAEPEDQEWSRGFAEVSTVKEFSEVMNQRHVFEWWRSAMGYTQGHSERI